MVGRRCRHGPRSFRASLRRAHRLRRAASHRRALEEVHREHGGSVVPGPGGSEGVDPAAARRSQNVTQPTPRRSRMGKRTMGDREVDRAIVDRINSRNRGVETQQRKTMAASTTTVVAVTRLKRKRKKKSKPKSRPKGLGLDYGGIQQ